jgi:hypothetical protein
MRQAVITHKRQQIVVEDTPAIPPELLLRRDRSVRYERNGAVYATDGRVGVLKRVVVNEAAGEVCELVIQGDDGRAVLVPIDLVDKTAGSAVFLTANRTQFSERAANAPVFEKKQFAAADRKVLVAAAAKIAEKLPRRGVDQIGKDFVETPAGSLIDRLDRKNAAPAP